MKKILCILGLIPLIAVVIFILCLPLILGGLKVWLICLGSLIIMISIMILFAFCIQVLTKDM
jgi:hypothetical protein